MKNVGGIVKKLVQRLKSAKPGTLEPNEVLERRAEIKRRKIILVNIHQNYWYQKTDKEVYRVYQLMKHKS